MGQRMIGAVESMAVPRLSCVRPVEMQAVVGREPLCDRGLTGATAAANPTDVLKPSLPTGLARTIAVLAGVRWS
jgi:hypothetical protein